jgi:carbohydrate kinase (thermoresistant glucokinase family)
MKVVVMGVSGCGKTSVGLALAQKLHARFVDADDLHPAANKAKMSSGIPLNDDDRWPWLDAVASNLEEQESTIVACSALKKAYRDRILAAAPGTVFVHLHGSREVLAERLGNRKGHFMPASLLDSQLETLEPLGPLEPGLVIDIDQPIEAIVSAATAALRE